MAETAKAMKGVEAIMRGESVNAVSTGAVKQVAPAAPYSLEGDKSMMMQEEPTDRMIEKERAPQDERIKYTEKDIVEHNAKHAELEKFFKGEAKKAQKAVAKLSSKSMMTAVKSGKPSKSGGRKDASSEDESYG